MRSNGVVTYVGKDIANQFWKFGLLGRDFRYRLFAHAGRRPAALGHDIGRQRSGGPAVRPGQAHLQRHRLAADVPAGAAQPGAADARAPATKPRTRSTSPTRWWRSRTPRRGSSATRPRPKARRRAQAVRRGLGPQGPRRQDRRPARPADREGRRRSRQAQPGDSRPTSRPARPDRLPSRPSATSC